MAKQDTLPHITHYYWQPFPLSILQIDFRTKNNVCLVWQPRQAFFPPSINQLRAGNTEYLPYRGEILCYWAKYFNHQEQFRVVEEPLENSYLTRKSKRGPAWNP